MNDIDGMEVKIKTADIEKKKNVKTQNIFYGINEFALLELVLFPVTRRSFGLSLLPSRTQPYDCKIPLRHPAL